ncbi:MAG: aminotransferase class III-fold pyridoxal phosphate-dependent enzyme [Candidatus Margulisbacteria bacterium]|nr:aminotransferase class III-fold pyridoxal phosphate-dependent enzyme [Candidatus Margulisiibacteriota bacterium]
MVVIGKALGNGHPISAVLGKKRVMEAAQETFISSSYWTERVGFVAALETIKQFEELRVIDYLKELGAYYDQKLKQLFQQLSLNIENIGCLTVPVLAIREDNPLVIKTIFTQEMLKRGYLATNLTYLSFAHTKKIIDDFLVVAQEVFNRIKKAKENAQLASLLDGEVCHGGFARLT